MLRARFGMSVITGAPGAGKSTVLKALSQKGVVTVDEVARNLLRHPSGMRMREENPAQFAWEMLDSQLTAYAVAAHGIRRPVVLDRGFADIAGFLELSGQFPLPQVEIASAVLRFDGPIFRAPPWQDIYVQDDQRIQTWEEAKASDAAICAAWSRHGYELIDLPFSSVDERVAFVLENASSVSPSSVQVVRPSFPRPCSLP